MTKYISIITITLLLTSCEKLVDVPAPSTQLIRKTVFNDNLTATSATVGLYTQLSTQGTLTSLTYVAGLSADELIVQQGDDQRQFYLNQLFSVNLTINSLWTDPYVGIFRANGIIEGLTQSTGVSASLKNQLLGEAMFFRAFYHFNLVNLFGDIPYISSTDYELNGLVTRMSSEKVYDKIIGDLIDAKNLLASDYAYSNGERTRINKFAAEAMLARVYLYTSKWSLAEAQVDELISNSSVFELLPGSQIDKVFLKNSREAIWQLIPISPANYVSDGGIFTQPAYNASVGTLSDDLAMAFENVDLRKSNWISTRHTGNVTWISPFKYKENANNGSGSEYQMVLRLAEQYLIRAEARAQQNKLLASAADLNAIRNRAGLTNTNAVTQQELLDAILEERRLELFVEWGHRWLDLKRTRKAGSVLSPLKTDWSTNDLLYPIPFSELQLNPNMTQNPGY